MPNVKGSPLTVPHRGDPNRKRVLGVLAQRRYRREQGFHHEYDVMLIASRRQSAQPEKPEEPSDRCINHVADCSAEQQLSPNTVAGWVRYEFIDSTTDPS